MGSIPGSGRSPGGKPGNPLQYSCLENSMEKGAWQATVHSVAKSQTQLRGLSTKNSTHSLLLKVFALTNILLLCCQRKKGIISQWVFSGGTSGRESV